MLSTLHSSAQSCESGLPSFPLHKCEYRDREVKFLLSHTRIPSKAVWLQSSGSYPLRIDNLRYADDTTLNDRKRRRTKELLLIFFLKSLLMEVKEESEKAGLKLNIKRTKIVASSPITSWHIDGETMETVTDFIFLGSKITADGDCRHEVKRCLLLGRKAMTNLENLLKSKDITLPTKVHLVKSTMVFPVVIRVGP